MTYYIAQEHTLTPKPGNLPGTLAPFATFTAYAIIAKVRNDQALLSAQAFGSLSLINLVAFPLLMFCQALPSATQGAACFKRVETYLLKEPASLPPSSSPAPSSDALGSRIPLRDIQTTATTQNALIRFENADISWLPESSEPVLHGLSLAVQPGLTAVIGPVASGKSTLLATMVGETAMNGGSMSSSLSGVAYCPQTPWIMNDTIRHNITGGLPFDQKWYDFSISSCGLQGDIERMPRGDFTKAGSNGASLSGGQRQRLVSAL